MTSSTHWQLTTAGLRPSAGRPLRGCWGCAWSDVAVATSRVGVYSTHRILHEDVAPYTSAPHAPRSASAPNYIQQIAQYIVDASRSSPACRCSWTRGVKLTGTVRAGSAADYEQLRACARRWREVATCRCAFIKTTGNIAAPVSCCTDDRRNIASSSDKHPKQNAAATFVGYM